jgi:hypothetical protein
VRAVAGLLTVASIACTVTPSGSQYEQASAAPLAARVEPDLPALVDGIPRNANLRVILDDYPDPDTAIFGSVLLRSGRGNFDATLSVDLVGRAIVIHPRALLAPSTTYEVSLSPGVRALDGRTIGDGGWVTQIAISANAAPPVPVHDRVVWATADPTETCDLETADSPIKQVACILRPCAPTCHSFDDGTATGRLPARRLNLVTDDPAADPIYGLVRVRAEGQLSPDAQLLRVAPNDSARSVLLRKLLGGEQHLATIDGQYPYPEVGVVGRRMPIPAQDLDPVTHEPTPQLPPLSDRQLAIIQRWIDEGATSH